MINTNNDNIMKHCPRCTKEYEIACYTYGLTYCDSCIDKRRAYRTANEPHYKSDNYYYYESTKERGFGAYQEMVFR